MMAKYIIAVVYLISLFRGLNNLSYDDIIAAGKSCAPKDTCSYDHGKSRKLESLRERHCACDNLCAVYGDCCIDANNLSLMKETKEDWMCKRLPQYGDVYMKHTCSSKWQGSAEIRELCETDGSNFDMDPMSTMPATNSLMGVTYKNFYCAICNNDSANVVLWKPRLECQSLNEYRKRLKNITREYVEANLAFNETMMHWGVYLYNHGELHFHSCYIDPYMPAYLESKIRICKPHAVSACIPGWHDQDTSDKCDSYVGVVYNNDISYKNVHCALCNGVNTTQLLCEAVEYRDFFYRTFVNHSFSLLLDIGEADGTEIGLSKPCRNGEIFDPFFKRCRNVICGFENFVYENGKCTSLLQKTTTTTPPVETTLLNGTSPWIPTSTIASNSNDTWDKEGSTDSSSGDWPQLTDSEDNSTSTILDNFTAISVLDDATTMNDVSTKMENVKIENINDSLPDNFLDFFDQHFLECPKAIIGKEFYVMYKNKSIYIPNYNSWHSPTAYLMNGTDVMVCFNFTVPKPKFSKYMGYITIVGLGISMLCLLLHFTAFILIPDLQNLSGKNLVSLAVSLFAAYSCFIIGRLNILGPALCTADAILTYYFFQVSFFWMNIMAYDVWRTLKMATTELRVSSGRQWKRFVTYSCYSWICPLLIVAAAVTVDNINSIPEEYHPGFGVSNCWFKHRRALMVFFASPLVAIMVANIFFFVFSARMIILTTKTTTKHQSSVPRRNFKLYLRLALIMGLTWTIGLVAGYVDLETLWYAFIILNTLQGLFIFVAFSCTRKVVTNMRDLLKGRRLLTAYRSSSLNSGSASGFNSNSTVHTHLGRKISPRESLDSRPSSHSDKLSKNK